MDDTEFAVLLGDIKGKVELILGTLQSDKTRMDGLDVRLRAQEKRSWYIAGASAVLALVGTKLGLITPLH